MKIRIIVNPKAGAGAAARTAKHVSSALLRAGAQHDIAETRAPRDATRLARTARAEGVEVVAVVGGDGTLNEVAQSFVGEAGEVVAGPSLALIPAGTGGDFSRLFGFERNPERAVRRILEGADKPLDLGVIEARSERGEPVRTAFVNIGSFGISGRVDRIVNQSPKWMGGRMAFAVGTVRAMATYRPAPVSIRVDGEAWFEGRIQVVAIANGRYFGGGMMIAPNADPGDGLFDVVAVGEVPLFTSLAMSPKLYAGTHLGHPSIRSTRGKRVEATPLTSDPVYIDSDGETPGRLPLSASIHPGAIKLRV